MYGMKKGHKCRVSSPYLLPPSSCSEPEGLWETMGGAGKQTDEHTQGRFCL
jgi:hypothetical protein